MPTGVDTSAEVEAKFRAHYLYSGNASASARAVGLPASTGRGLAQRLAEQPDFVEERRKLRARALDELVALRMRVARTAATRVFAPLPMPEHVSEGASVTVVDKRADYARVVLEAEKNAHNLARYDSERSGQLGGSREVVINITGPDGECKPSK
jgi:phage terminase small subunit